VFVFRVEVKLIIYQILVGKYKSIEHLVGEDFIKRQHNKRICAVWIRFIWIRPRSLKSFCENCDEVRAVVVQRFVKRT
jgi:hypothetical protein